MPLIQISATFPVLTKSKAAPPSSQSAVDFNIKIDSAMAVVTLIQNESYVQAVIKEFDISDKLFAWLKTTPPSYSAHPDDLSSELKCMISKLDAVARTVVESIKYLMSRPEILDNSIGMMAKFVWSKDNSKEHPIPIPGESYMTGYSMLSLGGENGKQMQYGFDNGYKPLVGMRHLFRAMQESEPRFKWIDATIALELAIKEALIRKNPELESLLLEMPSPPLHKLYGPIMKEFFGSASPHLKALQIGVEKRNKLMHRPDGVEITKEEASKYVQTVHKAIHHLFLQLYPEWPIARQMTHMVFEG